MPAADAADGGGHLVAVHADVRASVPAADRDRRALAAPAAGAAALRVVVAAAHLADVLPGGVPPGARADLAAPGTGDGALPRPAPLAHTRSVIAAGQRLAGPPAIRARRDGQRG